jgi:hypothetical protein
VREQASETWTVAVAEEDGSVAEAEEEKNRPVSIRAGQSDKEIIAPSLLLCLNIIPLFMYIMIA